MIVQLKNIDEELFLIINGMYNNFWDFVMYQSSEKLIWIPLYAVLLYYLIRHFKKNTLFIMLLIALLVFLTDQTSVLIKNSVERLRPCHEPHLEGLVHLVNNKCGGLYGFVSSHAANHFGLAVFISLLLNVGSKWIAISFLSWAAFISYSRIYLGVHYPGDVLFGGILGCIFGWMVFKIGRSTCLKGC